MGTHEAIESSPRLTLRWRIVTSAGPLAALSAAVLIPLVPSHAQPSSQTKVPSFFTSAAVDAIPPGSVVLGYPYPDGGLDLFFVPSHVIMLDQVFAGMRFKLIGGYGWFPSPTGVNGSFSPPVLEPKAVQAILDAAYHGDATARMWPLSLSNQTALRIFLRTHDVQTVVVLTKGQNPGAVVSYVSAAIGPPVESRGVAVWSHVTQRLRVHAVHGVPLAAAADEAFPKLLTHVRTPANGATVSGSVPLAATTSGYFQVTKVNYYASGGSLRDVADRCGGVPPVRMGDALEHEDRGQWHLSHTGGRV